MAENAISLFSIAQKGDGIQDEMGAGGGESLAGMGEKW